MSSSEMDSSSLSGELKFRTYAVLVAIAVAVSLVVCFWRLYRLIESARPQDILPVVSSSSGVSDDKVATLPVFVHGEAGAAEQEGSAGVECAVCLAEMRNGDRGRQLPRCGHRFHVECIDRWFRGNSTCPLCRAAAFAGEPGAVAANKGGSVSAPAVVVQA